MLFLNHLKWNAVFVGSFWAFSLILNVILKSALPIDMSKSGTPPVIVQVLPNIVIWIFGAYVMLFLAVQVYELLGPKLKKTGTNLALYGIVSFATLSMIFLDLLDIMAMQTNFYNIVYTSVSLLSVGQEIFLYVFPAINLFIILNLRNQKIEFEEA